MGIIGGTTDSKPVEQKVVVDKVLQPTPRVDSSSEQISDNTAVNTPNPSDDIGISSEKTKESLSIFANLTQEGQERAKEALSATNQEGWAAPNPIFNDDGTIKELEELERLVVEEGLGDLIELEGSSKDGYEARIDSDGDGKVDQIAYYDETGKKIAEEIDRKEGDDQHTILEYDENGQIKNIRDGEGGMYYLYNEEVGETSNGDKLNTVTRLNEDPGTQEEVVQYTNDEINYVWKDNDGDLKVDYEHGEFVHADESQKETQSSPSNAATPSEASSEAGWQGLSKSRQEIASEVEAIQTEQLEKLKEKREAVMDFQKKFESQIPPKEEDIEKASIKTIQ